MLTRRHVVIDGVIRPAGGLPRGVCLDGRRGVSRLEDTPKPGFHYVDREEISLSGIRRITVAGDIGCTGFYEESRILLRRVLAQKPDLFFFLGDLVFTGSAEEFRGIMDFCNSRVQAPVFSVCGNHDLPDYGRFLGLSSYALILDAFVCVGLDNATGYFSDADVAFLDRELNKHRKRNFLLFMHIPPPMDVSRNHLPSEEWKKVREVLDRNRERIVHIFCAHIHGYHTYRADGYPVTVSAGGGGAMIYDLREPAIKLHHSVVVNLRDDGTVSTEVVPSGPEAER